MGIYIEFCLTERDVFDGNECQSRKRAKTDEGSHDAKQSDITDVCEELLAVHVEATGKDDRWQDKVEEHVFIEGHDIVELLLAFCRVDSRANDANEANETCLMTKLKVVLVLVGLKEHENDQEGKDDDDALVEDLMLLCLSLSYDEWDFWLFCYRWLVACHVGMVCL